MDAVAFRLRHETNLGAMPAAELVEQMSGELAG